MAVVPTSHHVTLTYGTTTADQLGKLASLGGVVGLGMLVTLRPPTMQPARRLALTRARLPDDEPDVGLPDRSEDDDWAGAPRRRAAATVPRCRRRGARRRARCRAGDRP